MNSAPLHPKGRGSATNPANRFESISLEPCDDIDPADAPAPRTQFFADASKSIITYNESPDVGFDASINPYRGCEHGCAYCYARPFHEYLGFSAGLDFETRIMVKHDAPSLLRKELSAKKWKPQPIALSGATDVYQPVERNLRITRGCLEVLAEFRNPVIIITKNRLVTRDIDLLTQLTSHQGAFVFVSLTTLDLELNRALEPRSSTPKQRLDAIAQLADAGIPVGTLIAPVIPGLTDEELPNLLQAAAEAGATRANYIMLRLPHAVAPLFEQWLDTHIPGKKDRIMNRIRDTRGGEVYKPGFGTRMRGEGFWAQQISTLFHVLAKKHNLTRGKLNINSNAFRKPGSQQLTLLGTE